MYERMSNRGVTSRVPLEETNGDFPGGASFTRHTHSRDSPVQRPCGERCAVVDTDRAWQLALDECRFKERFD